MRHVLHLIKDPANRVALDVVATQAANADTRLSVVLLQDASGLTRSLPGEVFHLEDPSRRDAVSRYPPITWSRLLDLIFAADTVVTW